MYARMHVCMPVHLAYATPHHGCCMRIYAIWHARLSNLWRSYLPIELHQSASTYVSCVCVLSTASAHLFLRWTKRAQLVINSKNTKGGKVRNGEEGSVRRRVSLPVSSL